MSNYIPPNKRDNSKPSYNNQQPYRRQRYEVVEEERQAASKKKAEQEQERNSKCELTEDNFPALGAPVSKMSVWGGGTRSFASLAAEWSEKEKLDESKKTIQEKEELAKPVKHRQNIPLPRFQNVRRFRENDDKPEKVENSNQEESEWTLVERKKYRKEKTFEERIQQLEEKAEQEENDDSVWNNEAPNEHETCWEDRY